MAPTSFQEPAAGSKSAKFVTANPLDPLLRPFEAKDAHDDDPQRVLAESVNERLTKAMHELQVKHATGTNQVDHPDRAPTGPAYQAASTTTTTTAIQQQYPIPTVTPSNQNQQHKHDDDDDEDYDYLLDDDCGGDDDDHRVLAALRERRLAELKQQSEQKAADIARGHGQLRTIREDEFLPECTGSSKWITVHFFHQEFERCKIMDDRLKQIAVLHTECKFLRIDAERAPFFVHKLQIKTLPTIIVLRDGKVVDRLVGFEGLQTKKTLQHLERHFAQVKQADPDSWKTSALQLWLAKSGAINYTAPKDKNDGDGDDDDDGPTSQRYSRGSLMRHFDGDD